MSLWPNLTDSLRASSRVVSSDMTTSAPQEHCKIDNTKGRLQLQLVLRTLSHLS